MIVKQLAAMGLAAGLLWWATAATWKRRALIAVAAVGLTAIATR